MFSRSNMDYSLSDVTSESMRMYRKFIIEDCWDKKKVKIGQI
jgi:hypothetical protein